MFLVCVRTVFRDTKSWRAMSGPSRCVPSNRRTSSSRGLSGSISPWSRRAVSSGTPSASSRRCTWAEAPPCAVDHPQQSGHRHALVHEDPDKALRLGQRERAAQRRHRGRNVPLRLEGQCLQHQDLEHASAPTAVLRRLQEPVEQPHRVGERAPCPLGGGPREQRPGERHVLVLAEVIEVVVGGQPPLAHPGRASSSRPSVAHIRARTAWMGRTSGE